MRDSTAPPPIVPASPRNAGPVPLVPAASPITGGRAAGGPVTSVRTDRRAGRRAGGRRPLPDAQAISTFLVPEIEPPYDDGPPARSRTRTRPTRRGRPAGAPALGEDSARCGSQALQPAGGRLTDRPPADRPPADQPSGTGAWPSQFAQVLAETLAGSRPAGQIVPWTTEQARRRISQLGPLLAAGHRPRVRRVIVSSPASGVLEMTVIVGVGAHVRAVAVRLERVAVPQAPGPTSIQKPPSHAYNGRRATAVPWLCTDVEAA